MPDTPNPYAFEVAVRRGYATRPWYVYVWPANEDDENELSYGPFDTEADANTHADLVLAALKGATVSDELSDTHIGTVVTSYCPAHLDICDGADLDCCCSDLHQVDRHPHPIDALCTRHDIDIDGIVRLVDEVFGPLFDDEDGSYSDDDPDGFMFSAGWLRRLARGE